MDFSILSRLLPQLQGNAGAAPQLTFTPPLTDQQKAQLANQPLTIIQSAGRQITLETPAGTVLKATLNLPLPVGTRLNLGNLLASTGANGGATAGTTQAVQSTPTTTVLAARILAPAAPQTAPAATPQPQSPILPTVTLQLPAENTVAAVQNALTTTFISLLQTDTEAATIPLPTLQNAAQLLIPAPAAPIAIPPTTLPAFVPAGPVAVTFPNSPPPQTWLGQALTLIATAPPRADGTQPATLAPATPQPTPATPRPATVQVILNLGRALPQNTPLPALLPQQNAPTTTPTTLVLTQPVTPAGTTQPPSLPALPNLAVRVPPTAANIAPPPLNLPLPARVLPPQNGTQILQLASGQTLVLQSKEPLPTGSILVVEFSTPTAPNILRIQPSGPQTQQNQQPNTGTPQPTATQTAQAVPPAGTVLQGTITTVNEQGQPILTISQPSAWAGRTIAVVTPQPEATTHLVEGTHLSIRIEPNHLASILSLTLPQASQRAQTLNTLGRQWPTLKQALTVLQQNAPQQAQTLRTQIPQLSNLLPGLVGFVGALAGNRPQDAFDKSATDILKSMGVDLSPDLHHLAQLQQRPDANPNQWRGTLFPYVEAPGEDPRQGGFFWRREKPDDPRAATHTRFVVELDMSQMGPLQLDGLVTYPAVWLKLRRTTPPESGFTAGLQQLVTSLLEGYGLQGSITVENAAAFPVNPRAEMLAANPASLPTSA